MTTPTELEALVAEPDMSWFDIAVTHRREVVILGHSDGWSSYEIEHWWEDTFDTDAPKHLEPGAYRWTDFTIGYWGDSDHINCTGGKFAALSTPAARMPAGEVAQDLRSALEPCPFCGPESELRVAQWAAWYVRCEECRAEQIGLTEAEAIAAWNSRAALASDTNGNLDGVSARFIVNTAEAKLTSREDMRTALSLCASAARKALAQPAENAKAGEVWEGPAYEWGVTWGPVDLRNEINRLLGVYSHNRAMNIGGGYEQAQMIKDCLLDDLVSLYAHPAAAEPVGLRAVEGANSHVFDLRILIGDSDDEKAECIAFANEPWAGRIIAALATPARTDDAGALLDRAELAWQRFFYPAADNFAGLIGEKLPSVDLEVADCLRLVLAAMGRHVVTPSKDIPAVKPSRDAQVKTVAEKLAAFTGAPYEDWRHFTVEAGHIIDRLAALSPAPDRGEVDVLPCDVKLPPATTIRAGCSFDTLRLALNMEGRPRHFEDRKSGAFDLRAAIDLARKMDADDGGYPPPPPAGEAVQMAAKIGKIKARADAIAHLTVPEDGNYKGNGQYHRHFRIARDAALAAFEEVAVLQSGEGKA